MIARLIVPALALASLAAIGAGLARAQAQDPVGPCAAVQSEWPALSRSRDAAAITRFRSRIPNVCRALLADVNRALRPGQGARPTPQRLAAGAVLPRDCSYCPELVAIPAGSFRMGASANERGIDPASEPATAVAIVGAFAIARRETTFDEWSACVNEGGCNLHTPPDEGWGRGARPVINVSYEDARQYAAWLSRATGKSYRLPTEAEWEYAARAGARGRFANGEDASRLCAIANVADRHASLGAPCDDGHGERTAPAGAFAPNNWGLFDVHGNVAEWVADCWHVSHAGRPTDGSAWITGECSSRVVRGGSWFYAPQLVRLASREGVPPRTRGRTIGFRVVRNY